MKIGQNNYGTSFLKQSSNKAHKKFEKTESISTKKDKPKKNKKLSTSDIRDKIAKIENRKNAVNSGITSKLDPEETKSKLQRILKSGGFSFSNKERQVFSQILKS